MIASVARFAFAALLLALPRFADAATDPPRLAGAGSFFALSVPDVQASAKWYSEMLGLEVVLEPPRTEKAEVVVLEGAGIIVELVQHEGAMPLIQAAPKIESNLLVHGIFKAGVMVHDLDAVIALLKQRGVPIAIGPVPAKGKQRANLIIRDNAGNLIQFIGK
jgi:catechol 2,3-dioxygenase-like lactoylglutathione lyase family enzyme